MVRICPSEVQKRHAIGGFISGKIWFAIGILVCMCDCAGRVRRICGSCTPGLGGKPTFSRGGIVSLWWFIALVWFLVGDTAFNHHNPPLSLSLSYLICCIPFGFCSSFFFSWEEEKSRYLLDNKERKKESKGRDERSTLLAVQLLDCCAFLGQDSLLQPTACWVLAPLIRDMDEYVASMGEMGCMPSHPFCCPFPGHDPIRLGLGVILSVQICS